MPNDPSQFRPAHRSHRYHGLPVGDGSNQGLYALLVAYPDAGGRVQKEPRVTRTLWPDQNSRQSDITNPEFRHFSDFPPQPAGDSLVTLLPLRYLKSVILLDLARTRPQGHLGGAIKVLPVDSDRLRCQIVPNRQDKYPNSCHLTSRLSDTQKLYETYRVPFVGGLGSHPAVVPTVRTYSEDFRPRRLASTAGDSVSSARDSQQSFSSMAKVALSQFRPGRMGKSLPVRSGKEVPRVSC